MSALTKEGLAFEPAITFQDVWVGFDEGQVLRGVTFQVHERETLILLGETGTGKTLTLKMAAGLLTPNSGSVIVLGNEISEMSEKELLPFRRKIGFAPLPETQIQSAVSPGDWICVSGRGALRFDVGRGERGLPASRGPRGGRRNRTPSSGSSEIYRAGTHRRYASFRAVGGDEAARFDCQGADQ